MHRSRPLSFEQLEDRFTPTVWGNPWPDGAHLTLSFALDGTAVGSSSSTLFKTLNAVAPTAVWEQTILRAVQTWAVNANLNVGVVTDGGQPLGAPGQPEGDPRFGDIRVAAVPMAPDVLAITTPFDPLAGTWSGDIRLNSNYQFGTNGAAGIDLFTAMLHEAGHVFGLDDSSAPTSAMYDQYQGPRTGLSPADVAALQGLYGARQGDAFEGAAGNGSFATASGLNILQNPDGSLGIQANGDITTPQDTDYYRFVPPLNIGSFTVRVHTTGLSALESRLTVYNSFHQAVGTAVSTNPLGGDLAVTVNQLLPLSTYYAEVQSASGDVFGSGGYQLQVQATPVVGGLLGLLNNTVSTVQTVVNNTDLIPNNSLLTATLLPPLFSQTSSRFDYAYRGNLIGPSDVDYFRVQAPTPPAGTPVVLTAMVYGTDTRGLLPHLTVYDAGGNAVNAQVLVNENGTYTVQVANATPGAAYFIKVDASSAPAGHNAGGYLLAVQFGPQAQTLLAVTSGALDATRTETGGSLTVRTTELFHFVLSSAAVGNPSGVGVQLTILDAAGNVVATLPAPVGQPVSLTLLLTPGTYRFRYDVFAPAGQAIPRVTYSLSGIGVSDPIGPQPTDTTEDPQSAPPSDSTTSTDPSSTNTSSGDPTSTDDSSSDPTSTDPTSTDSTDPTSTDDSSSDPTSTDSTSTDSTSTDPTTTDPTDPTSSDSTDPSSPSDTSSDPSTPDSTWSYQDDPSGVQPEDPSSAPVAAALTRAQAPGRPAAPMPPAAGANEARGVAAPLDLGVHTAAIPTTRPAGFEQLTSLDGGKGIDAVGVVVNSGQHLEALPPSTPATTRALEEPVRSANLPTTAATAFGSFQVAQPATTVPPVRLLATPGNEASADTTGPLAESPRADEAAPPAALLPGDGEELSSAGRLAPSVRFAAAVAPSYLVEVPDGSLPREQAAKPEHPVWGELPVPQTTPVSGAEHELLVLTDLPLGQHEPTPQPIAERDMATSTPGALVAFALGAFVSGAAAHLGEPAHVRDRATVHMRLGGRAPSAT